MRAKGVLQPNDPDGLVRRAARVETGDALGRLTLLEWYECKPLRRLLSGAAAVGVAYRYRVTGERGRDDRQ